MIDDTRVLSKSLAASLTGLLLFITVVEFMLFTYNHGLPPHYSPVAKYTVYLSGFLVNPVLMFMATRSFRFKLLAIIWFHLSFGVLLLWFSEIYSPFTPLWSILILFASIYYGWWGFLGSSLSLLGTGVAYVLQFPGDLKPNGIIYMGQALIIIAMTIMISFLFVRIIMNGRKKNKELLNAHRSELMQVNRLNTLLNSISDAVLTLNRYGRVTSQNAAAQVFFDTNQSLIGRDIDKILGLTDLLNKPVRVRTLIDAIQASSMRDDLSVGSGGDMRHLGIQMSRIRSTFGDGEEYGVVLIIRDITKQKTLEDEKDEFISVTSHELRTPVAIAEGSLSNLILMEERGMPTIKLRDAAEMAHTQVVYLAKMINDLSTLSRAERGVGDMTEPIDVNDMIHNLYMKYVPEAAEKSLKLDLDADANLPKVETSRLYLEEILQNFITNAIKYTKEGSVTIGAKKSPNNHILFSVSDTGIGMSKSDITHIFEKFYRSEDYRTRETSGTGLGLYVVAKLAAKLETRVDVESRLNGGSKFTFDLAPRTSKLAEMAASAPIADPVAQPQPDIAA